MILIAVAYQKALGEKNMENSTETRLRDYTRKYTEQSQFQARLLSDLSRDKWYVFLFPTFERTLSDVRENARLIFSNTRKEYALERNDRHKRSNTTQVQHGNSTNRPDSIRTTQR